MPPTDRFVISFAAEPPQEPLPYGRWADTLAGHFISACREIDTQCELVDQRFTLIAPDNYRSDFLEVKLWSRSGEELARESLYVDDEDEEGEETGEEEESDGEA